MKYSIAAKTYSTVLLYSKGFFSLIIDSQSNVIIFEVFKTISKNSIDPSDSLECGLEHQWGSTHQHTFNTLSSQAFIKDSPDF